MADSDRFTGLNADSIGVPDTYKRQPMSGYNVQTGIYLAKVVDINDEHYQGSIWVELIGHSYNGDKSTEEGRHRYRKIRMTSPFGGQIQGQNYTNSYGATFQPPAPGSEILVAFTGREQEGFFIGVLHDISRNSQIPGVPLSDLTTDPNDAEGTLGMAMDHSAIRTQSGNSRPRHPVANAVARQGLALDGTRGVSSSGARRESPSNVSGFLTPGGHSIVMDDGTLAYQDQVVSVPDRSRAENQNNLIRMRSGAGAQILINDSAGLIYIINQTGSGWIQLDNDGNIDVYGEGHISMRTEQNFNVYADGDFNVESESINMRARGEQGIKIEAATSNVNIKSKLDTKITADRNMHLKALGYIRMTAPMIDLNGPAALAAIAPTMHNIPANRGVNRSSVPRVPEHEPWGGHLATESVVASQARSSLQPSTKDYNLTNQTGGGGPGSVSSAVPDTAPAPGLSTASDSSVNRYSVTDNHTARNQTADINPRTGRSFTDPNASGPQ